MSSATQLEKSTIKIADESQIRILSKYIFIVLPKVNKRLKYWTKRAAKIEDEVLRAQALNSLNTKDFHCHGGSIYAVLNEDQNNLLDLIVAYQTICDYLDNLCDRAGVTEEQAFVTLHQALIDALTPESTFTNYYGYYTYSQDNGYLEELVSCCKRVIRSLPSYHIIYKDVIYLADLYINLQVKKHLDWSIREQVLKDWAINNSRAYPFIKWQEYAAASGSTLALFALFNLATNPNLRSSEVETILNSYFPWICGLHILLDYFIDQEEDIKGGDLNFTFYYKDHKEMLDRLRFFIKNSILLAGSLPQGNFHQMIVEGLLAMYLSDDKVKRNGKHQVSMELIRATGRNTKNIYHICGLVRKFI